MGGSWRKVRRVFSSDGDNVDAFHDFHVTHVGEEFPRIEVRRDDTAPPLYPPLPDPFPGVEHGANRSSTPRVELERKVPDAPPYESLPRVPEPTRQPDPQDEMLQQLSCPICLDLYTDPLILPCLHSLCWGCADSLWKMMNPFLCPECKREIGRENLKRNFPLNNLVTIYKRDLEARAKRKEAIPTAKDVTLSSGVFKGTFVQPKTCVTCTQFPRVFCLKCSMAFCDTCLVDYHPTVEDTPEHPLMPVQPKAPVESETETLRRTVMQGGLYRVNGTLQRVNAEVIRRFLSSGQIPD